LHFFFSGSGLCTTDFFWQKVLLNQQYDEWFLIAEGSEHFLTPIAIRPVFVAW